MGRRWLDRIAADRVLVLDGGTGSELRRRGARIDPIAWSAPATLDAFDTLVDIHADYIRAGADIITTNTFGAARFVLEAAGHARDAHALPRRAVEAARIARSRDTRDIAIAGSMSCLPPGFDMRRYPIARRELAAYVELAETLAEAGADLLLLEMMQELEHAPLACEAARNTGLPFWLGVSCRQASEGDLVGFDFPQVALDDCLGLLLPFGPSAVAVMHSPVDAVEPAIAAVRRRWHGLLGAYPEIGDGTATASELSPAELGQAAQAWLHAGVQFIGGCCGTTPAHISVLAAGARHTL